MTPIGHFGVGLFSKRFAPGLPLWLLLLASWLPDALYLLFAGIGIESAANITAPASVPCPWSHSLAMVFAWALIAALLVYLIWRRKYDALVAGLLVVSHWILDWLVWSNEPLWVSLSSLSGIGLYDKYLLPLSHGGLYTLALETVLFIGGLTVYLHYLLSARKEHRKKQRVTR